MVMAAVGLATTAPTAVAAAPYVMERSDVRTMTSSAGERYTIYIHRPAAPAPASGYRVLYLLDGDDSFPVAAQTAERMARFGRDEGYGGLLVVAIGYAPEDMMERRAYDYTPTSGTDTDRAGRRTGGADAFRHFLAEELKPAIEEEFAVDETREAVWGHSYGGLFVLDTLLREPGLFDVYIASSPAIWFGDHKVLEGLAGLAARLERAGPRVVSVSVGELEQNLPEADPEDREAVARRERIMDARMVDASRALAQRLAEFDDLTVYQRVSTGEDHAATPLSGIAQAVQLASGVAPQ